MSVPPTEDLLRRIRSLRDLTATQLRALWPQVMGAETASFNGDWMRGRLARALAAQGPPGARVRLNRAVWSALRSPPPRPPRPRDPRIPPIGTWLRREHGGREISVKVMPSGFKFEGRLYRSLSQIARKVTGARWNGLLWFNLAERSRAKGGNA